jgi:hypothetical protein
MFSDWCMPGMGVNLWGARHLYVNPVSEQYHWHKNLPKARVEPVRAWKTLGFRRWTWAWRVASRLVGDNMQIYRHRRKGGVAARVVKDFDHVQSVRVLLNVATDRILELVRTLEAKPGKIQVSRRNNSAHPGILLPIKEAIIAGHTAEPGIDDRIVMMPSLWHWSRWSSISP